MPPRSPPPLSPQGLPLRGSAGPRVLNDIGLTDAELAAFLPPEAPTLLRSVLWCQFSGPARLEDIAAAFADRYTTRLVPDARRFPPDGPEEGVPVREVELMTRGRYARYTFLGMRGDHYIEDGHFQLEATFFGAGTGWGSNRALYSRFKALELPRIGAVDIVELTA
ncbi:MAG: hypothetical protein JNM72_23425 [Deltaproteobacteria bacterium]|nr:hypothetical protein [Deltaproteobacteria bacterium]